MPVAAGKVRPGELAIHRRVAYKRAVVTTRYATADDGAHLAYHVRGTGGVDLLVSSYGFISVASFDDEPHFARFLDHLGSFCRLICFDWRGIGLSDPFDPAHPPSLERQAKDVVCVLDAAGSERAAFLATFLAGSAAIRFAASYPTRTAALVLVNTTARLAKGPGYEFGVPLPVLQRFTDEVIEPAGAADTSAVVAVHAPSVAGDERFLTWWEDAGRHGASPAIALSVQRSLSDIDVRDLLPAIDAPVLVLQGRDTLWLRAGHGRFLAEHIPGATYVELAGADTPPFTENSEVILEEIEDFLLGTRHLHDRDRVLSTVLFTDIVRSTGRAVELGDRQWRETLDRYDDVVAKQIARHRGRLVKTTGDGALATFDSPARAIRCAQAIQTSVVALGLEVRAGLHSGEVDVRGGDVSGIAVHIAARVIETARPGEILASSALPPLLIGSGIEFESRGGHELRDVPGTWELYAVQP